MVKHEEVRRLEQKWLILSDLFSDLLRRRISVDAAERLRNCRTLLHFILTETHRESPAVEESTEKLRQTLETVKIDLFSATADLDEATAENWRREMDRAERGGMEKAMEHPSRAPRPKLPKGHYEDWMRLTLQYSVPQEKLQRIAEQFNVAVSLENQHHIIVCGEKDCVRKAVREIHDLAANE